MNNRAAVRMRTLALGGMLALIRLPCATFANQATSVKAGTGDQQVEKGAQASWLSDLPQTLAAPRW